MLSIEELEVVRERFWVKVEKHDDDCPCCDGCWWWRGTIISTTGRGRARINYRHHAAHRIAYELGVGPIPKGLCVLHRCDHPLCMRPSHLFVGTQQDNLADMRAKGRAAVISLPGERNPSARLTEQEVESIRDLSPRVSYRDLAARFGISKTQVARIVTGESWRNA